MPRLALLFAGFFASVFVGSLEWSVPVSLAEERVSFSRQVLPLLSDRCFHCHGPDPSHREAELRLDQRESAFEDRGGYAAIVEGEPSESELIARIVTEDTDLRMPPAEAHRKPLSEQEVALLRRWIDEGAEWGRHWSFEKPQRPTVPAGSHPVDAFVRRRLQREGLIVAPAAARETLIRRLSFDLNGLPPTPREVEQFLSDRTMTATETLVDRLLESPHFGERMAMWWLDAARYSDTDGYQQDATRKNWPWRDWVIRAFNENIPFDDFTVQQFAGDLLPDATAEQILATCFHRNHMTNGEGGRDPEESRIDYVIDRVNTTGTVWLGLTLGCCQCHSHKFDPVSQHDYYGLFAFFDSIDEDGKAGTSAKPYLDYRSPLAERAVQEAAAIVAARKPRAEQERQAAEQEFETWLSERIETVRSGFEPWHPLAARELTSIEGTYLQQEPDGTIQAGGPHPRQDDYRIVAASTLSRVTGLRLEVFPHASHTGGRLTRGKRGEFILTDVKLQVRRRGQSQLRDIEIGSAVADVEKDVSGRNYGKILDTLDDDPRNGWTTETHDPTEKHVAVYALDQPISLADDEELIFVMLHRSTVGDANIGRFRVSITDQAGDAVRSLAPMPLEELAAAVESEGAKVSQALRTRLLNQYLADHAEYQSARLDLERAERQFAEVKNAVGNLKVMVLAERKEPRQSFVLERGVWDKKGDPVQPSVPSAILARADEEVRTRLELARWLVDRENPLTARVIVNHLWQLCFGAGLVRTPEDFGLQGEFPTHPDLLDWLAVEFMESGWNVKHLLRIIVSSETYQQDSRLDAELRERDPENRLLARGARFRLPSWMIRDAALRTSGLLNPAIGGPPVRAYQPEGVWAEMFMGRFQYEPSQGAAQFRRTLYTFWRRSAAPTFLFDSAQRRVCEVRPRLTNTPLQALTLLNDHSLLEASRELAKISIGDKSEASESSSLDRMFQTILSRSPTPHELSVLSRELQRARDYYQQAPTAATQLLRFGQPERSQIEHPVEVASYMVVASLIYNLDEAITHE